MMIEYAWGVAGMALGIVLGVVITHWLYRRFRVREDRQLAEWTGQKLDAAVAGVADLELECKRLREVAESERRRREEIFEVVEGVLGERDGWVKHYYEQATQHGAAQSLLLRQIEQLAQRYHAKTGERPQLNPLVAHVVREFAEDHVARAEATGTQGLPVELPPAGALLTGG